VSYRSPNAASDDFAKQLLVLLGTLMTAITSFYLGAGTVTSAVKAGSDAAGAPPPASQPTFGPIKPTTPHSIATDGATLHLEISGSNLDKVTDVRLAKTGVPPILGTRLPGSSATRIAYDFDATKAGAGVWNIEIDESGSNTPKVAGTVAITS